jgi:hypothetical protein
MHRILLHYSVWKKARECCSQLTPVWMNLHVKLQIRFFITLITPMMIHTHTQWRHHKALTIMERQLIKCQQLATEQVKRQLKVQWHTLEADSFIYFFSTDSHMKNIMCYKDYSQNFSYFIQLSCVQFLDEIWILLRFKPHVGFRST